MGLFFLQFRHELTKLFARKRTYIGFGAFLLVESIVLFMLNRPKPQAIFRRFIEQNAFGFEAYFSGLTLGFQMILWTVFLLGGLYLALVSGDVVSKEVEEGTMRMMLCRPVSRVRIGMLKYLACVVYALALATFIVGSALLAGVLYKGLGGLFAFAPLDHLFALYELGPGLSRYAAALPVLGWCMVTFVSLGFMLSCTNMKPAAATIVTLTIFFFDYIFHNIPYFESYKPYFITTHMSAWVHVFARRVPVQDICEDLTYLTALDATCVIIGIVIFCQRDFKS